MRRTINEATSAKHNQRIPRKRSEKRLVINKESCLSRTMNTYSVLEYFHQSSLLFRITRYS